VGEAQLITLVMQGGFTALAAFLVWRLASASDAALCRQFHEAPRMAGRIDGLERSLVELTAQSVKAQNDLCGALRELKDTLEHKPCLHDAEAKHAIRTSANG